MSQEISLTQGKVTIVDDSDYESIACYSWCFARTGYAVARIDGKVQTMHRYLLNPPADMYVDHISRNRLDNRRDNLRIVTPRQSAMNRSKRRNAKSVFRGVAWIQGRWQAQIQLDGNLTVLGRYLTQRQAAQAYNDAALQYFGEYATLNDLSLLSSDDDPEVPQRKTESSYIGIFPDNRRHKWIASIMVNRRKYHLGQFDTDVEAAHAYDQYVIEHGLNRPLNLP